MRVSAAGVVARCRRLVLRIRHGDTALVGPPHQEVFRLGADLQRVAQVGQALELPPQNDPWSEGPRFAQDMGVALDDAEPGPPWSRHVRGEVRHREDVGRRRRLAHGPGGEPGEAGPVGHEPFDGGDGDQLGAGLAVHVHEHGEEEFHAVSLGRRDEIGCTSMEVGSLARGDRHAIALPLSSLLSAAPVNDVASRETHDGYCVVSNCCVAVNCWDA